MHNGTIYLSGGMQHAADLGTKWRAECTAVLKSMEYTAIDIAQLDIEYTTAHGDLIRNLNEKGQLQEKANMRWHFVHTDTQLVTNDSDAIIVLYDHSVRLGAGTVCECQIAYDCGIPVFLVNTFPTVSEVPGWLQALTTRIFDSFEDLYAYLRELPPGILKRDVYGNHNSGKHYLCSLCGDVFEKNKHHFVSKVSPLYCSACVDAVSNTYSRYAERYQFCKQRINKI